MMLVDAYADGWIQELTALNAAARPDRHTALVIDGAFVPGIHELIHKEDKFLLFEYLPGLSDEVRNVSPFLVRFDPANKQLARLLSRCDRWPMLSAIETPEPLAELCARLAAWCVVEADNQRFHFRFADTRRLPAVLGALSADQLASFCGPALSWRFIGRNGRWHEKALVPADVDLATAPVLAPSQFAALVDDSLPDELLNLFSLRGHPVYRHPSRSNALLSIARRVGETAELSREVLSEWCEWFWLQDEMQEDVAAALSLQVYFESKRE
jgi:hypothetical protein